MEIESGQVGGYSKVWLMAAIYRLEEGMAGTDRAAIIM
jgi:hypothetical protein